MLDDLDEVSSGYRGARRLKHTGTRFVDFTTLLLSSVTCTEMSMFSDGRGMLLRRGSPRRWAAPPACPMASMRFVPALALMSSDERCSVVSSIPSSESRTMKSTLSTRPPTPAVSVTVTVESSEP